MTEPIRVAILDDHPAIIDGYCFRLNQDAGIEVVATMHYGEELEPTLAQHPVDVLLLDVQVPTNAENANPYPIVYMIEKLLHAYPRLNVLVISMHAQAALIRTFMDAGASGYVLKDDQAAIQSLTAIVRTVASGGIHLSQMAYQLLRKRRIDELSQPLSTRQLEALSLCAAYPDASTADLARRMNIEGSTIRNLLSGAYLKLDVRTRAAAISKAHQLNLLTPEIDPYPLT
jgi:two-component system capsular synthesis response regulator RcsB